jgi:uncharacterized protein YbbC (DUF1343 family)
MKLVLTGADQTLLYVPEIQNKNVAIVANQTSVIGKKHLVDSLLSLHVQISRIFCPEHGFRGDFGAGDAINNSADQKTGIPLISLYGNKIKPTAEDLSGVDVVIYDIQDVGVRFYTYISTLHYVMEACAENKIPLIILDRPDPLGFYIDGPVLHKELTSFVGMHPIPVVYGMTAGELAKMINNEGWLSNQLHCDLHVIPCLNYDHNTRYQLPVNPSPNLNSMEAVYLYPSLCFFEGTIMSVGRGTDYPFRVAGHPQYPVRDFSFMPKPQKANPKPLYVNQTCYGIDLRKLTATDLENIHEIKLGWLLEAYHLMSPGNGFFTPFIDKLAGNHDFRSQIVQGDTEAQIRSTWQADLLRFKTLRKEYLLYNDFE